MATSEIPRRRRMDRWSPAEMAIRDAIEMVEALPPDERLTQAVILLGNAQEFVADFVDDVPYPPKFGPHATPTPEAGNGG